MTGKDSGHDGSPRPRRGGHFDGLTGPERQRVLADAVDFRGDVTLLLDDGSTLTGYVYGLEPEGAEPHVKLYPADANSTRARVALARIAGCDFSGRDTADGRSWEAWVRRYEEKKRLAAQGIDVGDIEPQPEEL